MGDRRRRWGYAGEEVALTPVGMNRRRTRLAVEWTVSTDRRAGKREKFRQIFSHLVRDDIFWIYLCASKLNSSNILSTCNKTRPRARDKMYPGHPKADGPADQRRQIHFLMVSIKMNGVGFYG